MRRQPTTDSRNSNRTGACFLAEMKEFAGFPKAAQRYIRRSLDVAFDRRDAVRRWSRTADEAAAIEAQARAYRRLPSIQASVPDGTELDAMAALLAPLVALLAFDLGEGRLTCFASCRFLYGRLIGGRVRPWLPAAFCGAAALPSLHPDRRRLLLRSMTEAAATAPGWSIREPVFFPEWVEKVDPAVAC